MEPKIGTQRTKYLSKKLSKKINHLALSKLIYSWASKAHKPTIQTETAGVVSLKLVSLTEVLLRARAPKQISAVLKIKHKFLIWM
jgi:hypothetical protein